MAWGIALMVQESAHAFQIRVLELEERKLELQLGFRNSISNQFP